MINLNLIINIINLIYIFCFFSQMFMNDNDHDDDCVLIVFKHIYINSKK